MIVRAQRLGRAPPIVDGLASPGLRFGPGISPMIGQELGHYRVETQLGAGGMGVVYRAHDTKLGRTMGEDRSSSM